MMKKMMTAVLLAALLPAAFAQRIVTLSPDVADVVVALGAAGEIVGRDGMTTNPALKNTPKIGLSHNLSVEPVAAQKPDLAIGSWMTQPPSVFAALNRIGIKAVNVAPDDSMAAYPESIRKIGALIGKKTQADKLAAHWQSSVKTQPATGKRYLISYNGRIVAGRDTAADELIRRAGGINAASAISGLKPMAREAWQAAKPDIIIVADHNQQAVGGVAGMLKRPEVAATPAGKNRRIYFLPANDVFRYGLNTPQILQQLNKLAR